LSTIILTKGGNQPVEKVKLVTYMTKEDKERYVTRADQLNVSMTAYITELCMWETRYNLLPQLRKGGTIVCNGKNKT